MRSASSHTPHTNTHLCVSAGFVELGMPQLERAGSITDLDLSPDTGLLESIHIVFFPNNKVGAEYNHFGPRISRLGNYLHEKSNEIVQAAVLNPLLRRDAAEQLERLTDLRVLDISIRPSHAEIARQVANDPLLDSFTSLQQVLGNHSKKIQVILKSEKEGRLEFLGNWKSKVAALLGNDEMRESMERLHLHGKCEDSNRVETIDLLKKQLMSTKRIIRINERSRALNSESAFQAIHEAYQELSKELEDAYSISQ